MLDYQVRVTLVPMRWPNHLIGVRYSRYVRLPMKGSWSCRRGLVFSPVGYAVIVSAHPMNDDMTKFCGGKFVCDSRIAMVSRLPGNKKTGMRKFIPVFVTWWCAMA